jgi:ribonuclease T1
LNQRQARGQALDFSRLLRHTIALRFSGLPGGFREVFFMLRTAASLVARSLVAVSLCAGLGAGADVAQARGDPRSAETTILVAQLPRQGQQTYTLIHQGGPFAHDKDGVVFGNRERLLPPKRRGYYREYTVETPARATAAPAASSAAACSAPNPTRAGTRATIIRASRGSSSHEGP